MRLIQTIVAGIVLVLVVSGATVVLDIEIPPGAESPAETTTPEPTSIDDGPSNYASIEISFGNYNGDPPFPERIDVGLTFYGYDELHYEDVLLCLYDSNGTVLQRANIGTISLRNTSHMSEQRNINLSVSQPPDFVLVDHPILRNDSRVETDPYVWNSEREVFETVNGYASLSEAFGYPRSNETGACG